MSLAQTTILSCNRLMNTAVSINEGYERAADILRSGGIVAVPTETVYGLAADATNAEAVTSIYTAKGRPSFNPLICHVSGLEMAQRFGTFDELAERLAQRFWPGPLTIVVPLKADTGIADAVSAGLPTIALRQPHGVMAKLAGTLDVPLAAPSANSSGRISPTEAQHVVNDLGNKVALVLDGGACEVGLESTIVKVSDGNVVLLREGGLTVEELETFLGAPIRKTVANAKVEAPGQLLAHYAPSLPIKLNATEAKEEEALLAFGHQDAEHPIMLNLSDEGDLEEAAHNLFSMMQELDKSGAKGIAVQSIPDTGLGAAINDRLKRAAHRT